jgi:hypothetical protein
MKSLIKTMRIPVNQCTAYGPHPDYTLASFRNRDAAISSQQQFDQRIILSEDAFDPDAVFMDDIVTDDVLPKLDLAVDGLISAREQDACDPEFRAEDLPEEQSAGLSPAGDLAIAEPNQLEVYGWESSWFKKIRGYIGF